VFSLNRQLYGLFSVLTKIESDRKCKSTKAHDGLIEIKKQDRVKSTRIALFWQKMHHGGRDFHDQTRLVASANIVTASATALTVELPSMTFNGQRGAVAVITTAATKMPIQVTQNR